MNEKDNTEGLPLSIAPLIALPCSEGFNIVLLNDIIYCEASRNYTVYYLVDRKVIVSRTLKESERTLRKYGFLRIHQSYIVNLSHIRKYLRSAGGSIIMSNRAELTVSPKWRKELLNVLIRLEQ